MTNLEILKYVDLLLKPAENSRLKKEYQIVNDAFNLYKLNAAPIKGMLLLLDDDNTVINIGSEKKKAEGFIGKKLNISKLGEINNNRDIFSIADGGFSIYYYKGPIIKSRGINLSLCLIENNEKDNDGVRRIESISSKICSSLDILAKYNNTHFLFDYLDSVEDGISTCDTAGHVTYANKACCDILGISKEEIIKGNREISPEYKPILKKILRDKKSIIDMDYFPKKGKETVHLINSTYPVLRDKGEVVGAIDIFRGIKRSTKLANTLMGHRVSYNFENIIGSSRVLMEKIGLAKGFSLSDSNVFIQGESGTGKELFAQSIHNYSRRSKESFIAINCANFPLELVDSELFGYEEGAFTGAKKGGKIGKFELASGGTLFLDEIGEMQLHLQAKLLRVLETKTLFRIGGNKPISIDVKIITATNRNLFDMVKNGEFREDLYYRLKVLSLEIPPLRDRDNDVLILAKHFIKKIGIGMGKEIKEVDNEGKRLLLKYNWPGNIRELENIIARALFICANDKITKEDLINAGIKLKRDNMIIKNDLKEINKEILIATLKQTKGNKKKTAEILGLSRPTIYRMIKKYNVKL